MPYFSTELSGARSQQDFNSYVNTTQAYLESEEYAAQRAQMLQARIDANRKQVCAVLCDYLNNTSTTTSVPANPSVYIGDLPPSDVTDLRTTLTNKGYTVVISTDGKTLTIVTDASLLIVPSMPPV